MGRTIFCEHYTGLHDNACAAGVVYESIQLGKGTPQMSMPCVIGSRRDYNPLGATCDKCKMPTPEELAAQDTRRFQDMALARNAIVAHLGGKWQRGMPSASGVIDCPVCETKQSLQFSRAGRNGHIHARCSTIGCVNWME